jgi:hypothetical protein
MHRGWNIIEHLAMAAISRTNTGNHVAEDFAGNDEHVELSGSHKLTSETSTQGISTISSPETTSDTNTQGLATISSPEPTE